MISALRVASRPLGFGLRARTLAPSILQLRGQQQLPVARFHGAQTRYYATQPTDKSADKASGSEVHPRQTPPSSSPASPGQDYLHEKNDYLLFHPVYSKEELASVKITHRPPQDYRDRIALGAVRGLRRFFDFMTGYRHDPDIVTNDSKAPKLTADVLSKDKNAPNGNTDLTKDVVRVPTNMDESKWLTRFIFLESIAGVPGMVAGMERHMRSLRSLRKDKGWIHQLLEEAENERMHLLTFMELKRAGIFMRFFILMGQGVFFNAYFLSYILAPSVCHRFVGYLEEEAVTTYTRAIRDLDDGKLPQWTNMDAPAIAKSYWRLKPDAKMRDVLMCIRADEANHRYVNHTFSDIGPNAANPFEYAVHQGLAEKHEVKNPREDQI